MKYLILPIIFASLFLRANAINDTRERSLSGFNALEVEDCFEVHYTESDSFRVYIDTLDGEMLSRTITNVIDGTLHLSYNGNRLERIPVYISAPELSKVVVQDVSSFIAESDINLPYADLSVSGTGSLTLRSLNTTLAHINKKGTGSFSMDGALVCDTLIGEVEGAGTMKLNSITSNITNISISGTCGCDIKGIVSTRKFLASMNGAGRINITGDIQAKETVWLEMIGAGAVKVAGHIYVRLLNIRLKGVGNITAQDIQVDKVDVVLKGIGTINLAGTANTMSQDKTGFGTIDTEGLTLSSNH
ncbi:MAG: DUF2807 domain-containing protein [Paludibacteraceae bacterium]|nr:DUF2807 domain-containing protein [Paludibacteraceae bacterium]